MTNIERIWLSEPDECNYHEVWFDSDYGGTEYIRTDLVAITTQPDPRDEVIAEAEARGMRRAAALARQALVDGAYIKRGSHQETPSSVMFLAETLVSNAILAAIPKGGDA